ncbi:MAG: CRISPR-associated endonuclease Cas1 [Verrucomicrobia bacterium]|nr:CRISPR-associated endonuclease Cas1 [Verrucomicrobiota bacterium]MCH8528801.1 CRISPR-associated endonuclease Cas1 [Kiritimatiellia bacterium]
MPTLYITSPDADVRLEQRHIVIRHPNDTEKHLRRIPLFEIDRVVLMGATRVGSPLIRKWLSRQIPVYFLKRTGKYEGGFMPYHETDTHLKIRQFDTLQQADWCLDNAKLLVHAKLRNGRRVLQKVSASKKDPPENNDLKKAVSILHRMSLQTLKADTLDEVRGCEGLGAAAYFRGFHALIPEPFRFQVRNRRPPTDPVNALLSLTYSMLTQEIRGAILAAGLEPGLGILHQPAQGRPTLALDLVEPFRAPVADMLVLRLLGLGIFSPDDFEIDSDSGGTRIKDDSIGRYFRQYEQRMERWFKTRQSQTHTTIRGLFRDTVQDLIKAIRCNGKLHPYLMP